MCCQFSKRICFVTLKLLGVVYTSIFSLNLFIRILLIKLYWFGRFGLRELFKLIISILVRSFISWNFEFSWLWKFRISFLALSLIKILFLNQVTQSLQFIFLKVHSFWGFRFFSIKMTSLDMLIKFILIHIRFVTSWVLTFKWSKFWMN